MTRRFSSRITLLLLFLIPAAFIIGKNIEFVLAGYTLDQYAGLASIVLGTFMFIQAKLLSKSVSIKRGVLELLLVLIGAVILIPQAYNYLVELNQYLDILITIIYVILMFLVALLTKNEHASDSYIRKNMLGGDDFADDPRFRKLMKRRR